MALRKDAHAPRAPDPAIKHACHANANVNGHPCLLLLLSLELAVLGTNTGSLRSRLSEETPQSILKETIRARKKHIQTFLTAATPQVPSPPTPPRCLCGRPKLPPLILAAPWGCPLPPGVL